MRSRSSALSDARPRGHDSPLRERRAGARGAGVPALLRRARQRYRPAGAGAGATPARRRHRERPRHLRASPTWQDVGRWARGWLVRFFNFVYFWLDFPLIAGARPASCTPRGAPLHLHPRRASCSRAPCALVCLRPVPGGAAATAAGDRRDRHAAGATTTSATRRSRPRSSSTRTPRCPACTSAGRCLLAIGVLRRFRAAPGGCGRWPLLHPLTQWRLDGVTGNHFFLDGAGGLRRRGLGWLLPWRCSAGATRAADA